MELARRDPALFLQRFPGPVLIDEVQYAPELLPYIKMAVDEDRRPGRFWLTGSRPFHLVREVSESLAGRVATASPRRRARVPCGTSAPWRGLISPSAPGA